LVGLPAALGHPGVIFAGSFGGFPGWRRRALARIQPVFHEEMLIVAQVQDLHLDVRMQLAKAANLAVLPGNKFLVHGGDFYVEIEFWQIEVRREALCGKAIPVPFDVERPRLVLPLDLVEIEKPGKLPLRVVRELG